MVTNVCKNCESYRADGSCRKSNCSMYRKAQKIVDDYCDTLEDCDGCLLHKLGCSIDWCDYRNQALVQVATALQSQEGQDWLLGIGTMEDLHHAMGMVTESELYDRWLAKEKAKDTRLEKLANLFRKLGVDEPEDVYYEAAGYLMEYKEQRERGRECF